MVEGPTAAAGGGYNAGGAPPVAPAGAQPGEAAWLQPGVRAFLCNLAKFPKLNGQEVEVKGWNAEKQRWKCLLPNGGDVNVMLSNLEPAEMPKDVVGRIDAALAEGRLFEAYMALNDKANAPQDLKEKLAALVAPGEHSEIIDGRLELVALEKKGFGYKAAKQIQQGDVLMFETAASTVKVDFSHMEQGPNMTSHIDDPHRKMAHDLRQKHKDKWIEEHIMVIRGPRNIDDKGVQKLQRVLEYSTFECSREPGRIAMFPASARFNHSCCPSAYADCTRSVLIIRALRDIPKGEEVCISYTPVSESLTQRTKKLEGYAFECDCERCQQEKQEDPQNTVPCSCSKHVFSMEKDTRLYQTCQTCYNTFTREEAEHHLSQVAEVNRKTVEAFRSEADPHEVLKRLMALEKYVKVGFRDGIPPYHGEAMFWLSNVANLNYHLAVKLKVEDAAEKLAAFVRHKKQSIERFEVRHSKLTNQRDVDFIQLLHVFLQSEGLSDEVKQNYSQKLKDACTLMFGQPYIPETVMGTRK